MTPTERQRILTEAEKEVSLDVTIDYEVEDIWVKGYVAGATAERDKARNQAIQDCIEKVNDFKSISDPVITFVFITITKALEQLKINNESSTIKRTN